MTIAMKLMCALFILSLLQMAMFTTVNCITPSKITRQVVKEDDIPRVQIKVFRGPTEEKDGESFATWGYWIKQPSG